MNEAKTSNGDDEECTDSYDSTIRNCEMEILINV